MSSHTNQPPPDFKPPTLNPNGWYSGQLREKQGVFSSQYVQFQYSRKLISNSKNLPTYLCTSDVLDLLLVKHAVLVMYVVLHSAVTLLEYD